MAPSMQTGLAFRDRVAQRQCLGTARLSGLPLICLEVITDVCVGQFAIWAQEFKVQHADDYTTKWIDGPPVRTKQPCG